MRYGHRTRPNTLTDDIASALDVRESGPAPPTGQRLDNALPPVNLGWDRIAIRSYSSTTGLSYWPHQRANVADSASGKDRRERPVGTPKQGAPTHRCHARSSRKRGNCRIDSNSGSSSIDSNRFHRPEGGRGWAVAARQPQASTL